MSRRHGGLSGLCICLAASFSARVAALPNPLADGLRRCSAETDQTRRLACFDSLAATLPKVEADSFGLTADIARKREPAAEPRAAEPTLPAKIAALRLSPDGRVIFSLDNHQVWIQSGSEPGKQFVVGDAVRIEHGAMGAFWLVADKARKTKVKRIS
jgi:hypothetical protein